MLPLCYRHFYFSALWNFIPFTVK